MSIENTKDVFNLLKSQKLKNHEKSNLSIVVLHKILYVK